MRIPSLVFACAILWGVTVVGAAQIAFDVPSSIECREVSPEGFVASHPVMKVIEGRFRISARVVAGDLEEVVDFLYEITSDDRTMRFQDYLPNTTLESKVADDQIEITASKEDGTNAGAQAHVAYKIVDLGANLNHTSKDSECKHYKEIAAKELVLASGTTDREHGVFFRLRPSRSASLEGAKEFTFLATVPVTWRGDLCTISCRARTKKSSLISSSVVPGGHTRAQIGMYLAGDLEAAKLADDLYRTQESLAALSDRAAKENAFDTFSRDAVVFLTGKKSEPNLRYKRDRAEQVLGEVRARLVNMAR